MQYNYASLDSGVCQRESFNTATILRHPHCCRADAAFRSRRHGYNNQRQERAAEAAGRARRLQQPDAGSQWLSYNQDRYSIIRLFKLYINVN